MKQLFVIVAILIISTSISDIIKGNISHQQSIGQPKSVKVSKKRYFFVGYHIDNGKQNASGNVQWFTYDGRLPVKAKVSEFLQKDIPSLEFTFDQLVITGLFEFKNETESEQFYNDQKVKP